jgi:hypothetical protein
MKPVLWAALSAMALASQGVRAAAPQASLFDDFTRDCAAHARDAASALNAVSAQGWKMVPQQQLQSKLPTVIPGLKTDWYHAYTGAQPGRSLVLFAGRGALPAGPDLPALPVAFCMLMQKPGDAASLQQAAAWTGASPSARNEIATTFAFAETPAGRRPVTPAEFYSDFQSGAGRALVTLSVPAQNTTGLMIVAPVQGAN